MSPGEFKWWMERVRGYLSIPMQLTGLLAFLKILGVPFWLGLALLPLGYVVYRIDRKYFAQGESEQGFKFGKRILQGDSHMRGLAMAEEHLRKYPDINPLNFPQNEEIPLETCTENKDKPSVRDLVDYSYTLRKFPYEARRSHAD